MYTARSSWETRRSRRRWPELAFPGELALEKSFFVVTSYKGGNLCSFVRVARGMAMYKNTKTKHRPGSRIYLLPISILAIAFICLYLSSVSGRRFALPSISSYRLRSDREPRYLYWGSKIDCPGKHCDSCEGLGHQESSLRCALEEAMVLQRTFVMPSRMCISSIHNKKGILRQSSSGSSEEQWAANSCSMDSLYDMRLISETVPVILDNSETWYRILATSMKLGDQGVAHVQGISRMDLKDDERYSNLLLINRTASPLSWFMECKDRNNRSAIALPYSFLPMMAAKKLRDAAEKIKRHLGDYDAIHVRRGDKMKIRKDRLGVGKTLHPHLDRDTRPEFIALRIAGWIPPGRTVFIASNERTPGFFSPLAARYRVVYSSNFTSILDPVIENNYQLFMVERLILAGARTFVRTFKEGADTDLSLTDDPKKNTKNWQIPVYTMDG